MPTVFLPLSRNTRIFWTSLLLTLTSIIGIGILSLPVKLYDCGLEPFILLLFLCGAVQVVSVLCLVEILEKVRRYMAQHAPHKRKVNTYATFAQSLEEKEDADLVASESTWENRNPSPDLHTMAVLLLPKWAYILFDFFAIFHFLAICMAYAISVGQLYLILLGTPFGIVVPTFVCVLSFVVFVFKVRMAGVVASMTIAKGAVLVLMIVMAGYVGFPLFHDTTTNWSATGQPFVLTTLALGGAVNIIPVLYQKVATPSETRALRMGCVSAVILCWALIVVWATIVLKVVPQHEQGQPISLEKAYRLQQISTVPLLQYLKDNSSSDTVGVISVVINIFCIVSVSISFLTMSLGLQHMLHGVAQHAVESLSPRFTVPQLSAVLFVAGQGLVLFVATFFSDNLFVLMESASSTALNIEAGIFIGAMYLMQLHRLPPEENSSRSKHILSTLCGYTIVSYFVFAVIMGIVQAV